MGYPRIPGLFTRGQADAVHAANGRIFVQIMHTGRIFNALNLPAGSVGVAPSAIVAEGSVWTDQAQLQPHGTPRALERDEIERVRDEFVRSARLAMTAGFDGVELHGANGYLLEQFLNPAVNQRDDEFGGSIANRSRFVLDVTRAVADVIGRDRTGIRLSPWSVNGAMPRYPEIHETYGYVAAELQRMGVVYLHLIRQAAPADPDLAAATVRSVREAFTGTLMLNGGFHTLAGIDAVLESGDADLVSVGRPFIANPDFIQRLKRGVPLAEANPTTFFGPGASGFAEGYTDYALAG